MYLWSVVCDGLSLLGLGFVCEPDVWRDGLYNALFMCKGQLAYEGMSQVHLYIVSVRQKPPELLLLQDPNKIVADLQAHNVSLHPTFRACGSATFDAFV